MQPASLLPTIAASCSAESSHAAESQPPQAGSGAAISQAGKGYISSLEEANRVLSECVDGFLEQINDMTKINEEIARTAEAMAKMANELDLRGKQ